MTSNSLCSICRSARALSLCICLPQLPLLCSACEFKHKASPDFHYLLPVASLDVVTAQNQREWKLWLVRLNDAQQELIRSAEVINRCKEEVISAYENVRRILQDQKENLLRELEARQSAISEAVKAAVRETYENCRDKNYEPTSACAGLIWSRATESDSPPIALLSCQISVSADKVREAVKVAIDFKARELEQLGIQRGYKEDPLGDIWKGEPKSPIPNIKLPSKFTNLKPLSRNIEGLRCVKSLEEGEAVRAKREKEPEADYQWTCSNCQMKHPIGSLKCSNCNRFRG